MSVPTSPRADNSSARDEPVTALTLLKISIEMSGAWAVGGTPAWGTGVDLPILVDPRGEHRVPYLPSTSLVGSLRSHLGSDAPRWLGPDLGGEDRTASPLWALGARWTSPNVVEDATTTAIDQRRGSAAAGSLRTAERAAPDTLDAAPKFHWYLQCDIEVSDDLLDTLCCWQPWIGRSRSAGLGRSRVTAVEAIRLDLTRPADLTWWLTTRADWLEGAAAGPSGATTARETDVEPTEWVWSVPFTVVDALAIGNGERTGTGVEGGARAATSRDVRRSGGYPIVPGTSWKGIFRHRVEHILAAIDLDPATATTIVGHLFGKSPSGESPGRRGLLRFADVGVVAAPCADSPDITTPAGVSKRMHVAIDRISGGTAEHLLYSVSSVNRGSHLTLRVTADTAPAAPLRSLLWWVVQDIHDGLIGVGGLSRSGHGTLNLRDTNQLADLAAVDASELQSLASKLSASGATS